MKDFMAAAERMRLPCATPVHEAKQAPHKPGPLPGGMCAVYVFSLSREHGATCAAGAHRVLKVGKAGAHSNARFQSQHYSCGSSQSNLAKSLLQARILWTYLGIESLTQENVGTWIKSHTDRDHFFVDTSEANTDEVLDQLEKFLRGRLGPVFEGG
jgi:hypothetical protein